MIACIKLPTLNVPYSSTMRWGRFTPGESRLREASDGILSTGGFGEGGEGDHLELQYFGSFEFLLGKVLVYEIRSCLQEV
jgi:hypothetical protein